MADHYHSDRPGHGGLYFVVGAVAVVVAILAFLYFGGQIGDGGDSVDRKIDVNVNTPRTTPAPSTPPATPQPAR
jgi:hypothetical protein